MISKQSGFNFSLNLMATIIVVRFCSFVFVFWQTDSRTLSKRNNIKFLLLCRQNTNIALL